MVKKARCLVMIGYRSGHDIVFLQHPSHGKSVVLYTLMPDSKSTGEGEMLQNNQKDWTNGTDADMDDRKRLTNMMARLPWKILH
jgi:hypothetical protein